MLVTCSACGGKHRVIPESRGVVCSCGSTLRIIHCPVCRTTFSSTFRQIDRPSYTFTCKKCASRFTERFDEFSAREVDRIGAVTVKGAALLTASSVPRPAESLQQGNSRTVSEQSTVLHDDYEYDITREKLKNEERVTIVYREKESSAPPAGEWDMVRIPSRIFTPGGFAASLLPALTLTLLVQFSLQLLSHEAFIPVMKSAPFLRSAFLWLPALTIFSLIAWSNLTLGLKVGGFPPLKAALHGAVRIVPLAGLLLGAGILLNGSIALLGLVPGFGPAGAAVAFIPLYLLIAGGLLAAPIVLFFYPAWLGFEKSLEPKNRFFPIIIRSFSRVIGLSVLIMAFTVSGILFLYQLHALTMKISIATASAVSGISPGALLSSVPPQFQKLTASPVFRADAHISSVSGGSAWSLAGMILGWFLALISVILNTLALMGAGTASLMAWDALRNNDRVSRRQWVMITSLAALFSILATAISIATR